MRFRAFLLLHACVLLVVPSHLAAQVVSDSLVGERVRLHLSRQDRSLEGFVERQQLRGILADVAGDSVTIRIHPESAPVHVAANGIYQIDVSRGVSRTRTAFQRGTQSAAVSALLGAAGGDEFGGSDLENMLIWAGGGFVFGAVLGAFLPEEHWDRIFHR